MFDFNLSEEEQRRLGNADSINALLSVSSIPEAARAAQLRGREQAAQRLRQQAGRDDMQALMLKDALDRRSGPFDGTGIEAQMLNIMLDPNIPDDDPRKIAARQRLERERTITTPEGVERIPGYDFGGEQPQGDFTPRNPSGDEKRGNLAVTQIEGAEPSGYKPNAMEEMAQEFLPASVATWFTSDPYAMDLAEQRQMLSNTIYLQSGAAASPEEVEKRRLEFFPQANDGADVIKRKQQNLEQFKLDAIEAFRSRGGGPPTLTGGPGDEFLE
ncbi:hypothetical protein EYC87_05290 [Halieaceae bacterium IMCC8485]|uniref:Uncharacterized protein n=1 Tax=Candidatus Seongchinamella marina TaxID=2518990 RepID=A0ABT3SSN1_9GAMM|nr:hypothetical protein [Candidatus Seongchinamella marina]MCX2972998.1 hypothetical protein [Candidatus Seongchinamella marina]